MSDSLTLYDIEQGLAAMMEARDEATTDEERAACEAAIMAYVQEEVRKVDNIRAYLRVAEEAAEAAKAEAERQRAREKTWRGRVSRLKAFCALVMEQHGLKRLEGMHGALLLRGNGGQRALTLNEEFLPDQFCEYTVLLSGEHYRVLAPILSGIARGITRSPNAAMIRAALAEGIDVPGARLEDRGYHVEVK